MMHAPVTPDASRQPGRVVVRPGPRQKWEVLAGPRQKSEFFVDRELALRYAQLWASTHRPSAVRAYGPTGAIEHEWVFN